MRDQALLRPFMVAVLPLIAGCSSSGGGSGEAHEDVVLLDLLFPDPSAQSGADSSQPPRNASLVQQVVFVFSGAPDPETVHSHSLQIRDAGLAPVSGEYSIDSNRVVFTPTLPVGSTASLTKGVAAGGAGLLPDRDYFIEVSSGAANSLANLVDVNAQLLARFPHPTLAETIFASFRTTSSPADFLTGLPVREVRQVSLSPVDGSTVPPFLWSDPDQLFSRNQPVELTFDGPLHPDLDNIGDTRFRFVDLENPSHPGGLPLGTVAKLVENRLQRSRIHMVPAGILPLGRLLALELPQELRHLSDPAAPAAALQISAVYRSESTATNPIRDAIVENFDTTDQLDSQASAAATGQVAAEWNRSSSGILQAAAALPGGGELGCFRPAFGSEDRTLILDTSYQTFPLLDGSTPDAPAGTTVEGGVFNFTEIDIPANIIVRPIGNHPLVLTATGSIRIAGTILVSGKEGATEKSRDSAVVPVPGGRGGVGGGNGGRSHPPVFYPPGQFGLMNLQSPRGGDPGGDGNSSIGGGEGGLSGIIDDPDVANPEISCAEQQWHNENGSHGAHGGGGSYFVRGERGKVGHGNMIPEVDGSYTDSGVRTIPGGRPGPTRFADNDLLNDFIGPTGELTEVAGGQGGGGGGSRLEGYYCGFAFPWGHNEFHSGWPDTTADSRGGGGGGGGGALVLRALGSIEILPGAKLLAEGGVGGGGETVGDSNYGGGGGGGSGGAVILQSATSIDVADTAELNVSGGFGDLTGPRGTGGDGLVQLQVPAGDLAQVSGSPVLPATSWVDPGNVLNTSEFSPVSVAVSRWFDFGRTLERPPAGTNPVLAFTGTDKHGRIATDANGWVEDADQKPFRVDYLGLRDPITDQYLSGEEPRSNWIPPSAEVIIEFEAADAIAPGSREVDPQSLSEWSATPSIANGRQFVRFRVSFNVARNGELLSATTRRPVLQNLTLSFQF